METVVDTSQRPLFGIDVERSPTASSFDLIFAEVVAELAREAAICVIINAQQTTKFELAHVKKIAAFGEKHDQLLGTYIRAMAFVIPSAMVRGALRVAFQIKSPPHPVQICKTEEEARAFLSPFLAKL